MIEDGTVHLIIYYASFLAFPYLFWLGYRIHKSKKYKSIGTLVFILGLSFIWARFIEPQLLFKQESTLNNTGIQANVLLVSDIHIGVYKGSGYLQRVVDKINNTPADFNILAGDFIYKMDDAELEQQLSAFRQLNRPSYFVLGNHDTAPRMKQVLVEMKLIDLEQKIIDLGVFQLAGVGDRWIGEDRIQFSDQIKDKPLLMITHNPDSTKNFNHPSIKLALAGHTHCGQVRIPYIYKKAIPSKEGHDCGLEQVQTQAGIIPLYISPGTGEIGLPMRIFNPPTINLLHLMP